MTQDDPLHDDLAALFSLNAELKERGEEDCTREDAERARQVCQGAINAASALDDEYDSDLLYAAMEIFIRRRSDTPQSWCQNVGPLAALLERLVRGEPVSRQDPSL